MLNSLLALLNSRESMRERVAGPVSIHISQLSGGYETPSEAARLGKDRVRVYTTLSFLDRTSHDAMQLADLAGSSKQTDRSFDVQLSRA